MIRPGVIGISFLVIASSLFANTEFAYQSIHDGRTPYLIVVKDDQGGSTREPGIYVADDQGAWHLAVAGDLLLDRTCRGIILPMEFTIVSERHEAVAVVNGVLRLFSVGSKAQSTLSTISFSEQDLLPVDPFTQAAFELNPIERLSDVSVAEGPADEDGQALFVSIRQKSPFGDGVTFGVYVALQGSEKADGRLKVSRPAILDYRFRSSQELKKLVVPQSLNQGGRYAFSPLIFKAFARPEEGDHRIVKSWRVLLRRAFEWTQNEGTGFSKDEKSELPVFDLTSGRPQMLSPLFEEIEFEGGLAQLIDPIKREERVYFGELDDELSEIMQKGVRGRVLEQGQQKQLGLWTDPEGTGFSSIIVDQSLYVRVGKDVLMLERGMPVDAGMPSFYLISHKVKDVSLDWLFRSEGGQNPKTIVYQFERIGKGPIQLKGEAKLLDQFLSPGEIRARIRNLTHDQIYFDHITPVQGSIESYEQVRRKTTALIDVNAALKAQNEEVFLEPVRSVNLNSYLTYHEFDPLGAKENQSAWIVSGAHKELFLRGQMLVSATGAYELAGFDASAHIKGAPDFRLSIVPVDPEFKNGERKFTLGLFLTPKITAGDGIRPQTQLVRIPVLTSFENLNSVTILRGRKKYANQFFIVLTFVNPLRVKEGLVSSSVIGLSLSRKDSDPADLYTVKSERTFVFENSARTTRDLQYQLVADQDGNLYWVKDREKEGQLKHSRLFKLSTGETLDISDQNFGLVKGRFQFLAEDIEGAGSQMSQSDRSEDSWEIPRVADFIKRFGSTVEFKERDLSHELLNFPGLEELLKRTLNGTTTQRPQALIVSAEDKQALHKLIMQYIQYGHHDLPSLSNGRLSFYAFDSLKSSQPAIEQNLKQLRDDRAPAKLFFADAKDLVNTIRPESENEETFKISFSQNADEMKLPITPHILYWLATSGRRVPAEDLKEGGFVKAPFGSLILATPEEWKRLTTDLGPEASVLWAFEVNHDYDLSRWKVWPAGARHAHPKIAEFASSPTTKLEEEILPELVKALNEAADPSQSPKHKVIIIPDVIVSFVDRLIYGKWTKPDSAAGAWSFKNPNLELYEMQVPGDKVTQENIVHHLNSIRARADSKRAVLLAPLASLQRQPRPLGAESETFMISDPAAQSGGFGAFGGLGGFQGDRSKPVPPHLLWLLASEGRLLKPEAFEKLNEGDRKVPTILVGTESEWDAVNNELGLERLFGIEKQFEVIRLSAPSMEVRKNLLARSLERPEIRALGYRFGGNDESLGAHPEDRETLLKYLVNRTDLLARQFEMDPTTAFIRVLQEFSRALVEDPSARQTRIISMAFLERILTKVFNIPLNLKTLSAEDPLVKLSNVRQFALDLQNAGYRGPLELKYELIHALLAQTRTGELGRSMPSSIILYGETSSGKTFLFEKLIEKLGLKVYDPDKPEKTDANVFVLKVGELNAFGGNERSGRGGMSVDQALDHLSHFLTLPNGYRGYILIDDWHKAADDQVIQKIYTFLNRLFEAKSGMIKVQPLKNGEPREIPVRNLNLMLAVNPPQDKDVKQRFAESNDLVDLIVASLTRPKLPIEKSLVMRFGHILDLRKFPREAQAPALLDALRSGSQNDFNLNNRIQLVDGRAVSAVTRRLADYNARDFLSNTAMGFLRLAEEASEGSSRFTIVVPKTFFGGEHSNPPELPLDRNSKERPASKIEAAIRSQAVSVPVNSKSFEGRFLLASYLVDNARTRIFESLIDAATQDDRFSGTAELRQYVLSPFLHAVTSHLEEKPSIPLSALHLDPTDFELGSPEAKTDFGRSLRVLMAAEGGKSYFPFRFADQIVSADLLKEFTDSGFRSPKWRTRVHVISEISARIEGIADKFVSHLLQVQSSRELPKPEDWLKNLKEVDRDEPLRVAGEEILALYEEFRGRLFDRSLQEMLEAKNYAEMNSFDVARFFMLALDRAVARLRWARIQQFLGRSVDQITASIDLGQLPGVQYYFFRSKNSFFRPLSRDQLMQLAQSTDAYKDVSEASRKSRIENFSNQCHRMISELGKSGKATP